MVAKTTVLQVAENINIDELLGVFNPTDFKAQPGRLIGAASGSQEFCAMFLLRGPKLGRGCRPRFMSRPEARELIAAMSPTELAACVSTAGRRVATTCALQREFSVSLIELLVDATRAEGVAGAARRWRHGARQCDQAEARRGGALASRRCESSRARRRTPFRTRFKVHGDDEVMFDEVGSPTRRRVRMRGETAAAAAAGAAKEEMRKMTCVRV